jgi:ligand-binding sensor domain-containing protein
LTIFLVCNSIFGFSSFQLKAQQYSKAWHYTVLSGLPSSSVYEMMMDSKGFIWFGSDNGVTRFDGQNFKTYTVEDGLRDNTVLRCFEDRQGRIWFSHLLSLPSYIENGVIKNFKNKNLNINVESSSRILQLPNDVIVIGVIGGMVHIDPKMKLEFYPSTKGECYLTLGVDQWKIMYHSNDVVTPRSKRDYKYECWKQMMDSLFHYNVIGHAGATRSFPFISKYFKNKVPDVFKNSPFRSAFQVVERDGVIYSCTPHGLVLYTLIEEKLKMTQVFFKDEIISSILFDDNKGIWVSTLNNGLHHMVLKIANKVEVNGREVRYIGKYKNELIIGDDNSSAYFLKNSKYQLITNLLIDHRDNNILIGHLDYANKLHLITSLGLVGLVKEASGKYSRKVIENIYMMSHCELGENDVLFSGLRGTYRFKDGVLSNPFPLDVDILRAYEIIKYENNVLIGNSEGLFSISVKDTLLSYPRQIFSKSIGNERINSIVRIDDYVLIGTTSKGLFLLKKNRLINFNTQNGLLSNHVDQIEEGKNGLFWVATDKGLQHFKLKGDEIIELRRVDTRSTMGSNDVESLIEYKNGLFVQANTGCYYIEIAEIQKIKELEINIDFFSVNGAIQSLTSAPLRLETNQNTVSLRLSSMNFSKHSTNYFFKVNNGAWETNSEGKLNLSSLSPGRYKIEYYSNSPFYKRSKSEVLIFYIAMPVYKEPWFLVVLAIVLIGVTTALVYWRADLNYNQKKRILSLELQSLQSQMNPHFTFNTMNSIQNFILKNDIRSSLDYLSKFSQLMRKILEQSRLQLVSLENEIDFLTTYIELEKNRMDSSFDYSILLGDGIRKEVQAIPSMLIQPFVENAIWHGLADIDYHGHLEIRFELQKGKFFVEIIDNGRGRKAAAEIKRKTKGHRSRGMTISESRMRLFQELYKAKIELKIDDGRDETEKGTIVRIELPSLKVELKTEVEGMDIDS